jgi:hypothetical protein
MFGWVEVFHGNNEDDFRRIEQAARDANIRCRGVEYNRPGKATQVSTQLTSHTVAAARGSAVNPNGVFSVYDADSERIYTLQVKRADLDKFQALRNETVH